MYPEDCDKVPDVYVPKEGSKSPTLSAFAEL